MAGGGGALGRLPPELLERVAVLLELRAALSLLCSCQLLHAALSRSLPFWRGLCRREGLGREEWGGEDTAEGCRARLASFRTAQRWVRDSGEPCAGQRIHVDINSFRFPKQAVEKNQRVLQLPEEAKVPLDFKTLKGGLIAENIFSHGLSETHFVLVVSNCNTFQSHLTAWRLGREVTFSFSLSPSSAPGHPLVALWVAAPEDLLLHGSLLLLMAGRAEPSNFFNESRPLDSDLIHIFDLEQDPHGPAFLRAVHRVAAPWSRLLPRVLKAGGGSRLRAWGGRLLAVCPLVERQYYTSAHQETQPVLQLKVFDLSGLPGRTEDGVKLLEPIFEERVAGVSPNMAYSYLACDQKGPNLVLAFSLAAPGPAPLSQQFLSVSLARPGRAAVHGAMTGMARVPGLMLTDSRRREECLVAAGEAYDEFAVMDAAGLVTVHAGGNVYRQFFPVYGICEDFDTNYDELHIYGDKVVTLKIFQNRELGVAGTKHSLLAVSSLAGELLWRTNTNISLTNASERLYLSPMFNHLFVSDARKCAVYGLRTGALVSTLHYPRYRRLSKELESADPEVSAYSQTGLSVWELRRVGGRMVVVHDIERVNPVIADIVDIC